eukprot:jgi/Mesvir1/18429/Mv14296-RA.1
MTSSQELLCAVCLSDKLKKGDFGYLICSDCGTQSQDFVEELEEDEGPVTTHGAGSAIKPKGPTRKKVREEKPVEEDPALHTLATNYAKAMQDMLQAICAALVTRFNCHPSLMGVVGQIWLELVHRSRILSEDLYVAYWETAAKASEMNKDIFVKPGAKWGKLDDFLEDLEEIENLEEEAEMEEEDEDEGSGNSEDDDDDGGVMCGKKDKEKEGEEDEDEEDEDEEDVDAEPFFTATEVTSKHRATAAVLSKHLPLVFLLVLPYMGCLWLKESILASDLARWALEGRLPYLSCHSVLPEEERKGPLKYFVLQPRHVPSPMFIHAHAAYLVEKLGLELPLAPFHGLARRFIADMGLPAALERYVERLYDIYPSPGLQGPLPTKRGESPVPPAPMYIMAYLLLTLKLLYGLDGCKRAKPPAGVPPPPVGGWQVWASRLRQWNPAVPSNQNSKEWMHGHSLESYVRLFREGAFAHASPPEDMEHVVGILDSLSGYQRTQGDATDGAGAGSIAGPSTAATGQGTAGDSRDPQGGIFLPSTGTGRERELGGNIGEEEEGEEEEDEDSLMAREAYVVYPPLRAVKGTRKPVEWDAEFVAVLATCASHIWVKPEYLFGVMKQVEEPLLQMEHVLTSFMSEAGAEDVEKSSLQRWNERRQKLARQQTEN